LGQAVLLNVLKKKEHGSPLPVFPFSWKGDEGWLWKKGPRGAQRVNMRTKKGKGKDITRGKKGVGKEQLLKKQEKKRDSQGGTKDQAK